MRSYKIGELVKITDDRKKFFNTADRKKFFNAEIRESIGIVVGTEKIEARHYASEYIKVCFVGNSQHPWTVSYSEIAPL